jgi:ornithine cyclodeaminase/alanine dehydrogenase-like protein (mu-crystallin family)
MKLLVLSDSDVRALLDYPACVSAVRVGLAALTAGQADQPLRTVIRSASAPGLMGLMPAYAAGGPDADATGAGDGAYGLKAICITPGNPAVGLDTHQGIVLLSHGPTGQPLAVLNASATPVLRREWISDGAHVNAVGACLPGARELDGPTVGTSALYCDSRDGLASESGDYLLAVAEGLAGPDDIRGTLGEVLAGTAPGRRGEAEITVFKSLGLAVEDLAAARAAYDTAAATGAGQWITF